MNESTYTIGSVDSVDKKKYKAIYCRVSTDEQNIQQQRQLLVDYCYRNGWQFRSYLDEAVSGKIADRPAWQELLREADRGTFDAILIVKTDRITRSLEYALWFYKWIMERPHIKLISLYDSINLETPDGYFQFMLNCLLSERELLINRWRGRIGIERAKKEGKYTGRKLGSKNKKTLLKMGVLTNDAKQTQVATQDNARV